MNFRLFTLLMIISLTSSVKAQLPLNQETGNVVFTSVVPLEGMNKDQIYKKAKMWVVSTLKSGDNMVELNGSTSDQIIGTGNIIIPDDEIKYFTNVFLNFKLIILCKDNRLKYQVENFTLSFMYINSHHTTGIEEFKSMFRKEKAQEKFENEVRIAVKKHIDSLVNNFIVFMNKEEDDEW